MVVVLGAVAFKIVHKVKVFAVIVLVVILYGKQVFNMIFKIYLAYELIHRMDHPSYTKPDRAFYGLYGFTVTLFMVCLAAQVNVMYLYYTKIK